MIHRNSKNQAIEPATAMRERVRLARQLGEQWETAPREAAFIANHLAEDPKMEVRCEVAESLSTAPEDAFRSLAARLSDDPCHFVKQAVARALRRRQQAATVESRRRTGANQLGADFSEFERLNGRKLAMEARRLAERVYDTLVGTVAHDMIGMLAPIRANTGTLLALIEAEQADPEKLATYLRRVRDRVAHMERLVKDMLAFSRSVPTSRRSEWIASIVADAVGEVQDQLKARGLPASNVRIQSSVPEGLMAEVSRHHVQAALRHMLTNACEAFLDGTKTLRPGTVSVTAGVVEGDQVRVAVQDTGPGIEPELLEELREFLPGRTTKRGFGTGLGLPTVNRYVAEHGGTVEITSERGVGTTVAIQFPIDT